MDARIRTKSVFAVLAATLLLGTAGGVAAERSALDEEQREEGERESARGKAELRTRAEAARRGAEARHREARRRRREAVERAEEARDSLRRGRRSADVSPIVLRFVHISAESFLETFEQLSEHEAVADIPMALNEEANAVVVLGPPPVLEHLEKIARGLDQPNEYRAHQLERQRHVHRMKLQAKAEEHEVRLRIERMELELEAARHRLEKGLLPFPPRPGGRPGCRCPDFGNAAKHPGRPSRPDCGCPRRRRRDAEGPACECPHRPKGDRPHRGCPEGDRPRGMWHRGEKDRSPMRHKDDRPSAKRRRIGGIWRLRSPRAAEEIGLSEQQARHIDAVLDRLEEGLADRMIDLWERIGGLSPEERREHLMQYYRESAEERRELVERTVERIMDRLSPEQRERAKAWMEGSRRRRGPRFEQAPPRHEGRHRHKRHRPGGERPAPAEPQQDRSGPHFLI
jgi:DNA-binding transcriptional MerR regulator